jgi:Tfp pilus assembly protein PilX
MNSNDAKPFVQNLRSGSTKHSRGVALVVSLLMVVVLLGVLMAITSTLSLSSRRITSDQRATQQAQFAAESGAALAYARRKESYTLINVLSIGPSVTNASLETDIQNFCDGTALAAGSGPASCTSNPNMTSANKFSLFTTYITTGYPTGVTPSAYWQDIFYDAGGSTPKQVQQVVSTYGGASNRYTLTGYGLIPVGAQRLGPGRYQLNLAASQLKGEVMVAGNVVSTRKIQLSMPSTTYTLTITRPSFAQYVLFRNQTTNTSGSQLYFSTTETFNGPVHTNGTPGFAGSPGPTFTGKFTSAASSFSGINGFACSSVAQLAGTCASNFTAGPPQFSQSSIPLPPNSNNQIRASYGGDATNTAAVTTAELNTAWGVPSVIPGVYYSAGNGVIRNTGSSWQGGLYISGTVDSMTLSTSGSYQVITIVQGAITTVFTQQSNGTWTVTVNGVLVKTLSASPAFNGMIYVAGSVTSLNGGGTTAADIASGSQLTLATSGDVNINKDITYTDDPRTSPLATNVLGIYSSGGNVKIDGPLGQDLNVQASIMATASGHGFGSVKYNQDIGGKHINLLGGIIEDQSQTVGTLGTPYGGYQRNYEYDPRFSLGFAPPFFPLQQQWADSMVDFSKPKTVWESK